MNSILLTAAGNPENQDRGLVLQDGCRVVLCVADGAGGLSGGAQAATLVIEMIRGDTSFLNDAKSCVEVLCKMDAAIAKDPIAGETTCVLTVVTSEWIFGASVGDSGVWLIPESGVTRNLSQGQERKPFLGSGNAWPIPFELLNPKGNLLLATDGLLKYALADRIIEICRQQPPELAAKRLIDSVRYPSGSLPDDVTLILVKL